MRYINLRFTLLYFLHYIIASVTVACILEQSGLQHVWKLHQHWVHCQ